MNQTNKKQTNKPNQNKQTKPREKTNNNNNKWKEVESVGGAADSLQCYISPLGWQNTIFPQRIN